MAFDPETFDPSKATLEEVRAAQIYVKTHNLAAKLAPDIHNTMLAHELSRGEKPNYKVLAVNAYFAATALAEEIIDNRRI